MKIKSVLALTPRNNNPKFQVDWLRNFDFIERKPSVTDDRQTDNKVNYRAPWSELKIDHLFEVSMNKELEKIYNWLAVNKLSLNVRKTKYMVFHTQGTKFTYTPKIFINGIEIKKGTKL